MLVGYGSLGAFFIVAAALHCVLLCVYMHLDSRLQVCCMLQHFRFLVFAHEQCNSPSIALQAECCGWWRPMVLGLGPKGTLTL